MRCAFALCLAAGLAVPPTVIAQNQAPVSVLTQTAPQGGAAHSKRSQSDDVGTEDRSKGNRDKVGVAVGLGILAAILSQRNREDAAEAPPKATPEPPKAIPTPGGEVHALRAARTEDQGPGCPRLARKLQHSGVWSNRGGWRYRPANLQNHRPLLGQTLRPCGRALAGVDRRGCEPSPSAEPGRQDCGGIASPQLTLRVLWTLSRPGTAGLNQRCNCRPPRPSSRSLGERPRQDGHRQDLSLACSDLPIPLCPSLGSLVFCS